jgi:uncharacterized protein (UPF0332 family)
MDGSHFYTLATTLAAGSAPAEMRSATSRAYYGAFHRACELLRSIGIGLPGGPECHKKLRWILEQSGDVDVVRASSKLNSLREARNDADYDLAAAKPERAKTVAVNLAAAKEVMDCINSCFTGPSKVSIHANMKKYASDILGLTVWQ